MSTPSGHQPPSLPRPALPTVRDALMRVVDLRWSPRLRDATDRAEQAARDRSHSWVGPEHLLWAMTEDRGGWAVGVLEELDVLHEVRSRIRAFLDDPELRWKAASLRRTPSSPWRLPAEALAVAAPRPTPRLRHTIGAAGDVARHVGHAHIGVEHVVAALCEDHGGVVGTLLDGLGIRSEVLARTRAFLTDPAYLEPCIALDANGRFLGWPTRDATGQWWIRRPNGRLSHPGDLL